VEDVETEIAAGGNAKSLEPRIEGLGLRFGVSTRLTSWIAVSEEPTVDPSAPILRVRMPHELPHGTSVDGLGLRAVGPARFSAMARGIGVGGMPLMDTLFGGMPSRPRVSVRASAASAPSQSPERQMRGRVARRDRGATVLELTFAEATTWSLPADVEITWDDGTTTRAVVLPERSTSPAHVAALASVRLAVASEDKRTITDVRLEVAGERWSVVF
jgi:hypothetical protein